MVVVDVVIDVRGDPSLSGSLDAAADSGSSTSPVLSPSFFAIEGLKVIFASSVSSSLLSALLPSSEGTVSSSARMCVLCKNTIDILS